jgi:hypothetical protein
MAVCGRDRTKSDSDPRENLSRRQRESRVEMLVESPAFDSIPDFRSGGDGYAAINSAGNSPQKRARDFLAFTT